MTTTPTTISPTSTGEDGITPEAPHRWRRLASALGVRRRSIFDAALLVALAGLAYIPLLVVRPGIETSDTKTYLYLDPGRFLREVTNMWDPSVGLGTVTHQYIGYLLPMGPFYWFFSAIGVPVWVAQRLWLGSMLFAAGAGVLYLGRTLQVRRPAIVVAALAYMLSPYFLQYAGRISVILLPWAGLPFMVAFTARALRTRGWRYPALFAIVVALTSGINATAIIYVGLAPVLWLVFAVFVQREASLRRGLVVMLQIGLLTALCCLWWITGLVVEAGYGVDVLRYTETLKATTSTSSASEVIRGLGYWYFYGQDRLGAWTQSALIYTHRTYLVALSYVAPFLGFLGGVIARWRYRAYFAVLALVGVVFSVGAHPFTHPTPVGGLLKKFMVDTTAGLALRSTDRATPLVILGLAMLLGAGLSALWRRFPKTSVPFIALSAAVIVAANPAIFNGDAEVASFFVQPAKLPAYQLAAIKHLNATHPGTRVLAIPGEQFASYRWGDTVDPPQPAFLTRPFVTREQQVMGSIATADLLAALDDPIELGTEQWNALAPMARLLSAGDVLVQYDQRFEHYNSPQPTLLAQQLAQTPVGLSDPVSFGRPVANTPSYSYVDDQNLASLTALPNPSPVVTYTVADPRPITRAESNGGALIVAGDGVGLQNLAAAGLLNTSSAIYYSSTLDKRPAQLRRLLSGGAALVLTDTNRKQAFRWDTFVGDYGYTETPSDHPSKTDPSDSPINLTPGAPADSKTVASYLGAVNVTASSYGNADSYTPEDAAYSAIDGNLDTAWTTGIGMSDPAGQWWQVAVPRPISADKLTLVQPQNGNTSRTITKVTLTFDGGRPVTEALSPASLAPTGQTITFAPRSFRTLRVRIDATSNDHESPSAATSVGFAEVEVPNLRVLQVIKMPEDLLSAAGTASLANRLTIDMVRQRVSPYSFPYRTDPETTIARAFTLPTARTFSLSGTASISALIPDDEIDTLVGREVPSSSPVIAYSKGRLPGDLAATASAAADGNPATAWQDGFGAAYQKGQWLEYDLRHPITFDHLDLQIVADGRHSVPTSITISTDQGSRAIQLPAIKDQPVKGATVSVPVSFAPLSGQRIRLTITGVRLEYGTNFYSSNPVALPMAIAEVGIPGVQVAPLPATLPGTCRSNLIAIDGRPISVEVVGSTASALQGGEMTLVPCGPDANGITLGAGTHVVTTALGHSTLTGWNVDQLTLDSAPGGGPGPAAPFGSLPATQPGPAPTVSVVGKTSTSEQLLVTGATGPFELVLGQSVNPGWRAVASPSPTSGEPPAKSHPVSLGGSELVDGFANGWAVSASDLGALGATKTGTFTVSLTWTPQREVWVALLISALALLVCLGIVLLPLRRLWRRGRAPAQAAVMPAAPAGWPGGDEGLEEGPRLCGPWLDRGRRPHLWAIPIAAGLIGAGVAAVSAPWIGLAVGAGALAALGFRWFRGLLSLPAVGLAGAAAGVVVASKLHHHFPHDLASWLVWIALGALAADSLVGVARSWRPLPVAPEPRGDRGGLVHLDEEDGVRPDRSAPGPAGGPPDVPGEDAPGSARLGGPGEEDRGQAGEPAEGPVEGPEGPGYVVVGGAADLDVDEPVGGQDLDEGAAGEDVEVPDDLGAGTAVDGPDGDLGEEGLDAEEDQDPVVPGGEVGGGEEQGAAGGEDPTDLGQRGVRVDQVLDDLGEDDHVEDAGGEGEPRTVDTPEGDGDQPVTSGAGGGAGPVDPDEPGPDPGPGEDGPGDLG